MSHWVTGDGWVEMLPMQKVLAHGMSPVHVAPLRAVWVVLEVEVILAILIYHAVRVVHPTIERCEVITWTILIGIGGIEGIAEFHQVQGEGILLQTKNLHDGILAISCLSCRILLQIERHIIVSPILSQADIHPSIVCITCGKDDLSLILLLLNWQEEIFRRVLHTDNRSITLVFDIHFLCKDRRGS